MAVTATIVVLFIATVAVIGGFFGYCHGYDKAWEEAIKCVEEETNNAVLQSQN